MRTILSILFSLFLLASALANNPWRDVAQSEIGNLQNTHFTPLPQAYRVVNLDFATLKDLLNNAPMEFTEAAKNNPFILTLPMPDGKEQSFEIAQSPIMEKGLADKFPEIKTYTLQGVDDPTATGRMSVNATKFRAAVLSIQGTFLIDPAGDHYISFYKKNKYVPKDYHLECNIEHNVSPSDQASTRSTNVGEELRTYRLAVSAIGEYSTYHGGTVNSVINAITNSVNRMNMVYERDFAVRFILVADNDQLVFLDAATDPFDNGNAAGMLNQNPSVINGIIGAGNYDIGHVFATQGSGLASLSSICSNNINQHKAGGTTGVSPPTGDFFDIDYAAHELGHQIGCFHTFNNCGNNTGNANVSTGFEPGSGATIMAYAGICGGTNIQFSSDDYFHGVSVQQGISFVENGASGCIASIATNNTPPTVEIIEGGFHIPISTPFELTAVGADSDGDAITYCWEQFDGDEVTTLGMPVGNAPHFRSFSPTTSPTRVFPRMQNIVNNIGTDVEVLPTYERTFTFNVTVRDNNAGAGGIAFEELEFDVTETAGPFLVTNPNTSTSWEVGDWLEINWDVANTDNNIVNCQSVNIKLSIDGGFTYPYTLSNNTNNDGSEFISVPNILTSQARVRVEAADNIFFDISNTNFSIVPPTSPGFAYSLTPNFQEVCVPTSSTIEILTDSLLGFNDAINYNITSTLPDGVVPSFSANPALPSDGSILTLDMSGYNTTDTFDITIEALAEGVDTFYRTVTIQTIGNDFSNFAMETPADGATGIAEVPELNWKKAASAEQYFIQIARSPTFETSTIHSEAMTSDTFFIPATQLELSTPYYWRVQASNECGSQDFLTVQSFSTIVFACETFEVNEDQTIASTGTALVETTINVPAGGNVSDVNVAKVKGNHSNMNHLDVSLVSPMGTEVILFANECLVSTNFDLGLDDEAPNTIFCPPTGGALYTPQEPLSSFDGEPTEGEWTLKTQVNNTAGNGGKIQNFHLELCSNVSLSPPVLITNELMPLPPSQGRAITDEFLLVEDDNNDPTELEFTLVTAPAHGQLFFMGNEISVGETFRQSSINAGSISYVHNGDNNQFDDFRFTVSDGEGGFIGTPQFNIEIDPDVVISVNELLQDEQIRIFPNPNDGNFNVVFENSIQERLRAQLFNVHGQLILEKNMNGSTSHFTIQTPHLAEGIYFLKLEIEGEFLVKKMVVK